RQVQMKPAIPLRQAAAELADAIVARCIQEFSGASHTAASPQGPMLSQPATAYSSPSRVASVAPVAAPAENELYVVKATGQGRGVAVPASGPQASTPSDQSAPVSMQRAPQTVPQVDSAFVF
ncbi:lytic transglycosylase domain-containing protein, partial [Xanthomonas perforans]|nr:lytic transglycosylase domain-containing protein [Xanthomonas perforans]